MEDTRIVELYLLRDESAIQETAEKYGGRLRALSFGMVRDWKNVKTIPMPRPGTPYRPMSPGTISTHFWPGSPGIFPSTAAGTAAA